MLQTQAAFHLFCLFRVALVAMLRQEGAYFLLEKDDLLGLKGLPANAQGTTQPD